MDRLCKKATSSEQDTKDGSKVLARIYYLEEKILCPALHSLRRAYFLSSLANEGTNKYHTAKNIANVTLITLSNVTLITFEAMHNVW